MTVGLVIVSHSAQLAEGLRELAGQMAHDVTIAAAGGTDDGGVGTSFDKVSEAISMADDGAGAVILTDLGSAVMTAESVLEFLDPSAAGRIRLADAPLVEGAVAAAVAAQSGANLQDVVRAAEEAANMFGASGNGAADSGEDQPGAPSGAVQDPAAGADVVPSGEAADQSQQQPERSGEWELINPMGLHARPAAVIAQAMAGLDAEVNINGVDAKSVMRLMTLGLGKGETLKITARGQDAGRAIDIVGREVQNGFDELQG